MNERRGLGSGPRYVRAGAGTSCMVPAPVANAETFCSVVAAMPASASSVKKAWWPVTSTFGNVSRRVGAEEADGATRGSAPWRPEWQRGP